MFIMMPLFISFFVTLEKAFETMYISNYIYYKISNNTIDGPIPIGY